MIFIIEDDPFMAECIARAVKKSGQDSAVFADAISAMTALSDTEASGALPDLIFLDVLLTGPDGFTFLNELVSYDNTAKIPVVLVTSLDLKGQDLSAYGVRRVLSKDTFTPEDIKKCIKDFVK